MGGELVREETSLKTIAEFFDQECPWYMSIGMSYDEFWYGTPDLARAYRKMFKVKRSRENVERYEMGAYVYQALCCASPLFLSLAPQGTTAHPYPEDPFPVTQEEVEEQKLKAERRKMEKFKAYMDSFIAQQETAKGGD